MSRKSTEQPPVPIELLSPARNIECGIAAIDHGADAVYIGASRFGARAAAGNSVDDIRRLCDYAHPFGVRVYATVNTILYDSEIPEAEALIWQLYEAEVDALIVQDMALLGMNLPPIALHASTQMDNRSPQKVAWLTSLGFRQVVVARELSLDDIRRIHLEVPSARIEAFVHGALCVSLSGRCYASQACFGRSANRGECAQFCRLPFSLVDADGNLLTHDRYPLSLRDMNRSRSLEEMMDAGVRSFKIEGRLKDVSYVKNVTAYYRQAIDRILERRTEYERSSFGQSTFTFTPDPQRSFSRGFTEYLLHGRTHDLASPLTPKSRGVRVGEVEQVHRDHLVVSAIMPLSNGDGLNFIDAEGRLQGFRVNRAQPLSEAQPTLFRLYPAQMPLLQRGTVLHRNYDQRWETLLSRPTAVRKISLSWLLEETPGGFRLTATLPGGRTFAGEFPCEHQPARTPQDESIRETLSRLGDTVYEATEVDVRFSQPWFVPRSLLAEWRRTLLASIQLAPQRNAESEIQTSESPGGDPEWAVNVSNRLARKFYEDHRLPVSETAFELADVPSARDDARVLMQCRYCLRYELGKCPREVKAKDNSRGRYYLVSQDGKRFLLEFNCKECMMLLRRA